MGNLSEEICKLQNLYLRNIMTKELNTKFIILSGLSGVGKTIVNRNKKITPENFISGVLFIHQSPVFTLITLIITCSIPIFSFM